MRRGLAAAIAIAASVGAGVIHLALGPEHLEELGALGWGFYLAAALQVGWAVAALVVATMPARVLPALFAPAVGGRRIAMAGIAINVAIIGAWVISRTFGLPAGEVPWMPEAVGRADSISALLEVAIITAILIGVDRTQAVQSERVRRYREPARGRTRFATVLAVLVIATGTGAAVAPDASHAASHSAEHDADHHADHDADHEADADALAGSEPNMPDAESAEVSADDGHLDDGHHDADHEHTP